MKTFIRKYDLYILAVLLYLPFIFLGYGADYDSYGVLEAGKNFAATLDYVPSRGPGFVVFETITFFLNTLGGSFLTNLGSLLMALLVLYSFLTLTKQYQIPHSRWLALILLIQPYFWVNATCTMDFLYALGFALFGWVLLLRGHWFTAGVALALGIGSRLTTGLLAAWILLFIFMVRPEYRLKTFLAGLVTAVFAITFYLPPADFVGWTTRFLVPTVGGSEYWSFYLRLGRFVYRNLIFWSIPGLLVLAAVLLLACLNLKKILRSPQKGIFLFALSLILAYEVFYLWIPTEISYLLPTVPLWLIVCGVVLAERRKILYGLLAVLFLANFVIINVARPDVPNHATAATYGLWIEAGHLIADSRVRLEYMACGYQPCK